MFSEEILLGPSYSLEDIPDFSKLKGHLGIIQTPPAPHLHPPPTSTRKNDVLTSDSLWLVELGVRASFHIQVHAAVILQLDSRKEKLETVKRGLGKSQGLFVGREF